MRGSPEDLPMQELLRPPVGRRSVAKMPSLLWAAVKLVWQAARREFIFSIALQAFAMAAVKRSGAHDFLSRFPAAYQTYLSRMYTGGKEPSTGQWQQIALARAFFRDAPFIILDEPSAALDPRAESALFESIRQLWAGRCVLVISHRFSSVRSADRIYVLKEGRVAEHGTHAQLMQQAGLYAEMFNLQASAYHPEAK